MELMGLFGSRIFGRAPNHFRHCYDAVRLKFPVFEVINRAMSFTSLSPGVGPAPQVFFYSRAAEVLGTEVVW